MKRFAFRLERVARVREIERDRALGAWSAARAREAQLEADLAAVREAARAEAVGLVPGQPTDLRATAFRAGLRAQAVHQTRGELQQATAAAQAAGQVLQTAARRVDALDRLRTGAREAWQVEARRDDTRTLDDIVTTRAGRTAGRRA